MITETTYDELFERWQAVSGSSKDAEVFAATISSSTDSRRFQHAAAAATALIEERVGVSRGISLLTASDVVYNLYQSGVGPSKAAARFVLAAVAVGGSPDGMKPAWQHMTDTEHIAKNEELAPSHPVKGINSPSGARTAYNTCTGDHGEAGSVATRNRGPADQQYE